MFLYTTHKNINNCGLVPEKIITLSSYYKNMDLLMCVI
jgi:hypothetical protein